MANRDKLAQVPDLDMSTRLLPTPASAPQLVRDGHGRFQTGNIGGPGRPRGFANDDFIAAQPRGVWWAERFATSEQIQSLSTPEQKCISWPEQKYISDAGNKAPELGAFS